MVVGENQKIAAALILVDKKKITEYLKENNLDVPQDSLMSKCPEVIKMIHEEVEKANKHLAPHENVKKFKIIDDDWSPANGMLSQTLKLKRKEIFKKYKDLIDDIYSGN